MTITLELTLESLAPLVPRLKVAIDWLNSEQPADAVLSHHGIHLIDKAGVPLSVSLAPVAAEGYPVLVFDTGWVEDSQSITGRSQPVFSEASIDALRQTITQAGGQIRSEWNGTGYCAATFMLTPYAGDGVARLVSNYRKHMHQYGFNWPDEVSEGYKWTIKPEGWA